jgi:CheY-like chemotaxis protein
MGGESRVRILVMDADDLVRGTIRIMLEAAGYDVALAVSGQDGVRRFDDEPFDLVICGIFMAIMEGF